MRKAIVLGMGGIVAAGLGAGCEGGYDIPPSSNVDAYGQVEAIGGWRSLSLAREPERSVVDEPVRVLMDGVERRDFYWVPEDATEAPREGRSGPAPAALDHSLVPLVDRKERFLRETGIRLKRDLRDAGLRTGLTAAEAERIARKVTGSEPAHRDVSAAPLDGVVLTAGIPDHSHDRVERVMYQIFNGFGWTIAWLTHRNGELETWEVQTDN
ncbi:MAG: hypothetical protein L0216_03410 [Planctomycetales bacterium]|nr:hypothetical protein [Planctomycetales bacterium]